ncbi:MAG: hypothetical protein ABI675_07600 [Chitinophagaceae bacterium]
MTKKIIYMMVLICGLSLFSSAKQLGIGCIKEYQESKNNCTKKKTSGSKKIITANIRPFHFYLFNI